MTDQALQLAGDFAAPTIEQWEKEVLKVLNRKRPEGKELTIDQALARLRSTTVDGLTIEPLYTLEGDPAPLGYPGIMPFTRGTAVRSGSGWDVRALHEDPDVAVSNAAVLDDLQRGATSLWLRVGSDAIAAADVAAVLAGVKPEMCAVAVSAVEDQQVAADALAAFFRASGQQDKVVGNFGIDPLAAAALTGAPADLSVLAGAVATAREFPGVRALVVDMLPYDNAGAGDVEVLAYALATGVEYVRALDAAGVAPGEAFGQLAFRVPASADQFTTIARLRALRRLWARVGEVLEVPEAERGALQHAVTSWRMITRDDAYVNLLRGTIATFAAAVGGAEIITTLPFDTAHGLPTGFSRRMARNTQLVAAEEANLGRVTDPAGGAWFVEAMTTQLAEKAWALFQSIEAAGGMARALADGVVAGQIAEVVAERAKRLATRKQPITGVSMFPLAVEPEIETRPRPAAPVRAGLRPVRDSEAFEGLRDAVAAAGKPPVFLACLGERRDFGGREQFTSNLLLVGGFSIPESEGGTPEEIAAQVAASGATMVILCSSARVYAAQAMAVAGALKAAGVPTVFIAGRKAEVADEAVDTVIDGEVFDGMDVVAFTRATLDRLGAAK
nr:methylmalonyl-CoA mutase small subunit [Propionibacterium sp.]